MKFTEFTFKNYIQEALEDLKFVEATEVQEKLIPVVLSGRDLVGGIKDRFWEDPYFSATDFSKAE